MSRDKIAHFVAWFGMTILLGILIPGVLVLFLPPVIGLLKEMTDRTGFSLGDLAADLLGWGAALLVLRTV